jgi:hypothetical protein
MKSAFVGSALCARARFVCQTQLQGKFDDARLTFEVAFGKRSNSFAREFKTRTREIIFHDAARAILPADFRVEMQIRAVGARGEKRRVELRHIKPFGGKQRITTRFVVELQMRAGEPFEIDAVFCTVAQERGLLRLPQ